MNTVDKLNNTLGYLTAMSFDKPELSNELVEPLNTLSEAISEVENLALSGVSQHRELLLAYEIYNASEDDKKNNMKYLENLVDTYLANNCG